METSIVGSKFQCRSCLVSNIRATTATTLRQFVVTQEIDLIARDQVALHQATKPGDTEGVPVGSVPAPN